MSKIVFITPNDVSKAKSIVDEATQRIKKITIMTIDYPPVQIVADSQGSNVETKNKWFWKENNSALVVDVAGMIIEVESKLDYDNKIETQNVNGKKIDDELIKMQKTKKILIISTDTFMFNNKDQNVISINGTCEILPNEVISNIYKNFGDLKTVKLDELEELINVSSEDNSIKEFNKLGNYFNAKNYIINNNLFNLIEHQEAANKVSKKVLLKKLIAWEIKR